MLVQSVLSLLFGAFFWNQVYSATQYLKILDFGNGPNTTLAKARLTSVNLTQRHEESTLVYGIFHTTEELDKMDQVDNLLYRRSRDPDGNRTWQYFQNIKWGKNTCFFLSMKNMIWSTLIDAIHPSFQCSWKVGDYYIQGGTWDMDKLAFFRLPSQYEWKMIINVYKNKDFFSSWLAIFTFEDKKGTHA